VVLPGVEAADSGDEALSLSRRAVDALRDLIDAGLLVQCSAGSGA
jgi:hypothetical protein